MNPYKTPASSLPASPRKPSILWWVYFAVIAALAATTLPAVLLATSMPSQVKLISLLSSGADIAALSALVFYIRQRPVLNPTVWRVLLAVCAAKTAYGTYILAGNAMTFSGPERKVALAGLAGGVLAFPLLYALARYAFSKSLWGGAHRRNAA